MQQRRSAASKHALVIGIDDYRRGIPPLTSAVADARAIAAVLADQHGYQVTALLDADASLAGIRAALAALVAAAGPRDRVLFYFAGHGIAEDAGPEDEGPRGFFIPHDAEKSRTDTFLAMTEVRELLARPNIHQLLLLLDCCFAGSFQWSSTRDLRVARPKLYKERYERYLREPAWQAIASSACDERALDVVDGKVLGERAAGHSPFAAACIEGLRSAADRGAGGRSGDGVLLASELYLFIEETFFRQEQITGRRQQTPSLWSFGGPKHTRGQFIFELRDADPTRLPSALALDEANNPYRGLSPYAESSAGLFFGREAATRALFEAVTRQALTVVVGASGTGKSSLVAAGLLPRLRASTAPRYRILATQRPESAPLTALERLAEQLEQPRATSLADAVAAALERDPETHLVVVLDQLEELVTQTADAAVRAAFLRAIDEAAARGAGRLHVVMTLRLDFEAHFAELLAPRDAGAPRFLIPHMSRAELRQIVEGPASERVLYFEPPALVDALIDEVIDAPGALPLLSFTLSEMYREYVRRARDDRTLREDDYAALGGVSGALARRADEVYTGLSELEQTTMRRLLLRMVVPGEAARRQVPESELRFADEAEGARVRSICARLIDARLAASGKDALGRSFIEPAHDKLVTGWPRLQTFLDAERDTMALMHAIGHAAAQWEAGGRAAGLLWDDDPRRPQARALRRGDPARFNLLEQEFVERSQQRRDRTRITVITAVSLAFVGLATIAAIAWYERDKARAAQAETEVQRTEAERQATRATDEATRARDQARMAAIRAASADATLRATILREVERPDALRGFLRAAAELREAPLARAVLKHQGTIRALQFSPDGERVLTAADDGTARVWRLDDPDHPVVLVKDLVDSSLIFGMATAAEFSPDGRRVIAAGVHGTARLWQADGGGSPIDLKCDDCEATHFSPDGARVLLVGREFLALYHVDRGGEPIVLLPLSAERQVARARFSPDGRRIAAELKDGGALVWSLRDDGAGEPTVLGGPGQDLKVLALAPDASRAVVGSPRGAQLRQIDGTGASLDLSTKPDEILSAAFSPDGTTVATVSSDAQVRLWPVDGKAAPIVLASPAGASAIVEFSPDGARLVVKSRDKSRTMLSTDGGGAPVSLTSPERPGKLGSFSADGARLSIEYADGTVAVTRPGAASEPLVIRGHDPAFSRDGRLVAVISSDHEVRVWRTDPPKHATVVSTHDDAIATAVLSPDGARVVTASFDRTARVSPIQGASAPISLPHTSEVRTVALSRDGARVLTVAEGGNVRVWRADGSGQPLDLSDGVNLAAEFSPDGTRVATLSSDNRVRIWSLDGEPRARLLGEKTHADDSVHMYYSLRFSPDGRQLVATYGASAYLWRVDEPGEPRVLAGHAAELRSARFSPDARRLATASDDHTARLWSLDSPGDPRVLAGHRMPVLDAVFSPDGTVLATPSLDATARIWRVDGPGDPLVLIHATEVDQAVFSPDSARVATASGNEAWIWRVDGSDDPIVLRGHKGPLGLAGFTGSGRELLTFSADFTARLWTLPTPQESLEALWCATPYCVPIDERVVLLGDTPADARTHYQACRTRVGACDRPR